MHRVQRVCAHVTAATGAEPAGADSEGLRTTMARINYRRLAPDGLRLRYVQENGAPNPEAFELAEHAVLDGRGRGHSLEREGHVLMPHRSALDLSLLDPERPGGRDEEARAAYSREMEVLATAALEQAGMRVKLVLCDGVHPVFVRKTGFQTSPETVKSGAAGVSGLAHADCGEDMMGADLQRRLGDQGLLERKGLSADDLAGCRMIVLQMWRPISEAPVEMDPLAVLDPRSLADDDMFGTGMNEQ